MFRWFEKLAKRNVQDSDSFALSVLIQRFASAVASRVLQQLPIRPGEGGFLSPSNQEDESCVLQRSSIRVAEGGGGG